MSSALARPHLPTYQTSAAVLEGETGAGLKLAAWTVARTMLIAPPMLLVGATPRQAWVGAGVASMFISGLTLLRIFHGHNEMMGAALAGSARRARSTRRPRSTPRRRPRR